MCPGVPITKLVYELCSFQFTLTIFEGRPVEGKDYDYQSISRVVDRILIMEYDQRRQAFDSPCLARPTLDLYYGIGGVLAWSNTSLDFNRTILALPCFTLDFECIDTNGYACEVKPSNYRGSKCSSQIGKRIPYNELGNYHPEAGITTGFDEHANFAICNYSVSYELASYTTRVKPL